MSEQSTNDAVSEKLAYERRFKKVANMIHSASNFNEILIGMKDEMSKLFDADRMTVYLVDAKNKEIFSRVKTGKFPHEIRIPISTKSLAGFVAATGRKINIKNVYDDTELSSVDPDLSFDKSWDEKTGYKTGQVLAVPVIFKRSMLGVIQLINKKTGGQFALDDENNLADIAETLGIAFNNQYRLSRKIPLKYDGLVKNGVITEKGLNKAMQSAKDQRIDLEKVLVTDFEIPKNELGNNLAKYFGVPYEDLEESEYNPLNLLRGVNLEYFRKAYWIPLEKEENKIILAINDPNDQTKVQEIRQVFRTGNVELRFALKEDIELFVANLDAISVKTSPSLEEGEELSLDNLLEDIEEMEEGSLVEEEEVETASASDSIVVKLARKIIEDAYNQDASDIHIEPYNKVDADVRYRVDGQCYMALQIPRQYTKAVIARMKILAKLDISERRKPQDGKIKFRTSKGKDIELRVATIPTCGNNEDVVMRILAASEPLPLDVIMPKATFDRFTEIITKPYGIALVVGPTGSGKTTTLHSALGYINKPERKIWTAEDPVEITQHGLRQVQTHAKIGYTFAAAMRAFLRADPDVIMVGEMRDKETVAMGLEASLTGHLVFSTLHTNSAPETITRLVDMGMDPFNFADALLGILAQRLVRTYCGECREPYHPEQNEFDHLKEQYGDFFEERVGIVYNDDFQLHKPVGCDKCKGSGLRGRAGLYELLVASEPIKKAIMDRALVEDLKELAVQEGMIPLLQDGIAKIYEGRADMGMIKAVCS